MRDFWCRNELVARAVARSPRFRQLDPKVVNTEADWCVRADVSKETDLVLAGLVAYVDGMNQGWLLLYSRVRIVIPAIDALTRCGEVLKVE